MLSFYNSDNPAPETYEQQMRDSEAIFTAITHGAFDNYQQAEQAVFLMFATDGAVSRSGISHALKRLEKFYRDGGHNAVLTRGTHKDKQCADVDPSRATTS